MRYPGLVRYAGHRSLLASSETRKWNTLQSKMWPLGVTVCSSKSENIPHWTVMDVDWMLLFLMVSYNILLQRIMRQDHFDLIVTFKVIQVGAVTDRIKKAIGELQSQFPLWNKNPITIEWPLFCELLPLNYQIHCETYQHNFYFKHTQRHYIHIFHVYLFEILRNGGNACLPQ